VTQIPWSNWWVFYLDVAERECNDFGVKLINHTSINLSRLGITGTVPSRAIERQSNSVTTPKKSAD